MAKPASSVLDLDGFDWSILALVQRDNTVPPNVKWFKTLVALDRVKVGLEIPVE